MTFGMLWSYATAVGKHYLRERVSISSIGQHFRKMVIEYFSEVLGNSLYA